MAGSEPRGGGQALSSIQVAMRVRPLNTRELGEGFRNCVSFDDATQQVVLSAVDRSTLAQLRGSSAKAYAFDGRYGTAASSDAIYDDTVRQLVASFLKGYNATVLAYGQTGSGKTLTMSGGTGIGGQPEKGIIRRVAEDVLAGVAALRAGHKPGESTVVRAHALELYNEELRDLSSSSSVGGAGGGGGSAGGAAGGGGGGGGGKAAAAGGEAPEAAGGVRIVERPNGRDGRCTPEVVGVQAVEVQDAEGLLAFFSACFDNRAVGQTKMNSHSSRSHAIYTIVVSRTLVDVSEAGDKVSTSVLESRFHLVDLAGSERVKRSGVTGAAFKEAVAINGGLLALGNVITALSSAAQGGGGGEAAADGCASPEPCGGEACAAGATGRASAAGAAGRAAAPAKAKHIPYRDSKLTRLLQDSLGGNALTLLVSCISSCEADFEETHSTLKYSNRACAIKNAPLPNRCLMMEEALLPLLPAGGGAGGQSALQVQLLLEEHARMKAAAEAREAARRDKEERRLAELRALREGERKCPGFQRLRMAQYDDLRKKLSSSHGGGGLGRGEVIADETLAGFKKHGDDGSTDAPADDAYAGLPSYMRPTTASRSVGGPGGPSGSGGGHARPATAQPYASAPRRPGSRCSNGSGSAGPGSRCSSPDVLCLDSAAAAGGAAAPQHAGDQPPTVSADALSQQPGSSRTAQESGADESGMEAEPAGSAAAGGGKLAQPAVLVPLTADASSAAAAAASAAAPAAAAAFSVLGFQPPEPPPAAAACEPAPALPPPPQLLARFRVNTQDTVAVFRAVSAEDLADVAALLPAGTALPAADRMTYLLARLEVACASAAQLADALRRVGAGASSMASAVGPPVGCLMATFGTRLIADVIYDFDEPQQLAGVGQQQRLELWGLQIPHTAVRPALAADGGQAGGCGGAASSNAAAAGSADASPRHSLLAPPEQTQLCWSSTDRLNVFVGLLYALCNLAQEVGAVAGLCVPRPQLLRRWLQAGVAMRQASPGTKLIYPPTSHDHGYYKAATLAFFLVAEVQASLARVLSVVAC